jgi:Uma2 family endonuclease
MAAITENQTLGFDEFMRLQEEGAGFEYEYGRFIPLSPVEIQQSTVVGEFHWSLTSYVKQHRCGRVWLDVITYLDTEGKVRYFPDIVYLANDVMDRCDGRRIVGAPTLVVEVTTPETDSREEGPKKIQYHAAGVPWYWVANLVRGRTEEYRYEETGYVLVSDTPFNTPFRSALFPNLEILIAPDES